MITNISIYVITKRISALALRVAAFGLPISQVEVGWNCRTAAIKTFLAELSDVCADRDFELAKAYNLPPEERQEAIDESRSCPKT